MRPRTVNLRPELAAKAGTATVTAREDDDGLPGVYLGDERLRCFTLSEEEEIFSSVPARQDDLVAQNDRHAKDRAMPVTKTWRTKAVHYGRRRSA